VQKAHEIYHLANGWMVQEAPSWSYAQHAVRPPVKPQFSWPNMAALAFSFMAICLVVFQFEVSVDNGLLISFGGSQSEAEFRNYWRNSLKSFKPSKI